MKLNTAYLKRVGAGILLGTVAVALIAYVSYHLWRSLSTDFTTVTALKSEVEITAKTTGYIFRNETVLSSNVTGNTVRIAENGEKVGINDTVVRIYGGGGSDTAEEIAEIDREIKLLTDSLVDGTLTLYDSTAVDTAIINLMKSLSASGASGDYASSDALKSTLKQKLIKRGLMTMTTAEVENMIADLNTERSRLMRSLGTCLAEVKAPTSGYYMSSADGYEYAFTKETALTLTFGTLDRLTALATDGSEASSVGKIASDFVWYIACELNESDVGKIEEGDEKTVIFPSSSSVKLKMTAVNVDTERKTGRMLVVFETDVMPTGFDFTRVQQIAILKDTVECFKIPLDAMRVVDGKTGVYVLDGSTVYFRRVEVIMQSDDCYLAEISPEGDSGEYKWLMRNDIIITKGTNLYHGRILS